MLIIKIYYIYNDIILLAVINKEIFYGMADNKNILSLYTNVTEG